MDLGPRMLIELLREGQTVRFTARGGSMWPAVRDGSLVEVTPCAASTLCEGELGAYEGAVGVVVHRYVGRRGESLVFRGDARPADEVVSEARVLGRARVVTSPPWRLGAPSMRHAEMAARAARTWLRRRLART